MDSLLINLFFAYSREDSVLRSRLDKHLSGLKRRRYVNTWYDGRIDAGKEWEKEIDYALSKADIILLLISADFIASDYCYEVEMKKAIARHERGDAVIIPVLLHPCDWSDLPFSKIQGLPQNGKAISSSFWETPEQAFNEIAQSIKDTVEELKKAKGKQLKSISEVLHEKDYELKVTLTQIDECELELEILQESIAKASEEHHELLLFSKQLKDAVGEIESTLIAERDRYDKLMRSDQIELNKIRAERESTKNELTKLKGQLEKLKETKQNLSDEIKKMNKQIQFGK